VKPTKIALITGSSRGIGASCALLFAQKGYGVIVNYLKNGDKAEELCKKIGEIGGTAVAYRADVRLQSDVEAMFEFAEKEFGGIDVLVNNAGISTWGLLQDTTEDEWNDLFSVAPGGAFRCSKVAIGQMLRRGGGSIVNISSVWGVYGASCEAAYSASKAAVIGLTKALAKELGPSGIRVNCVAPGVIDTDMNRVHGEETLRDLAEATPLGRIGTPEEVAECVYFLASDESRFVTGQVLGVDGGFCGL